jgi:hypothetical protein
MGMIIVPKKAKLEMMIKNFCKLFLEEFSDIILAIFIKMG